MKNVRIIDALFALYQKTKEGVIDLDQAALCIERSITQLETDMASVWLAKSVYDLAPFRVRARKALRRLNVVTVADLTALSRQDLLDARNMGPITVDELQRALQAVKLDLRPE